MVNTANEPVYISASFGDTLRYSIPMERWIAELLLFHFSRGVDPRPYFSAMPSTANRITSARVIRVPEVTT